MTNSISGGPLGRNSNLDLVKLVSCVAVVILHCLYTPEFEPSRLIYQLFAFAVPCFFMASGYVLLAKKTVTWTYVSRKLLGIARTVLIWCVIIFGLRILGLTIRQGAGQVDYLSQIKLYAGYTVKSVFQRGLLWQFWYLGATGILYLLLPVLIRYIFKGPICEAPRRGWILWGLFLGMSVTIQLIGMITGHPVQEGIIQTFRLWSTVQFFLLGGLMPSVILWAGQRISVRCHLVLAAVLTVLTLGWRLLADHLWLHGVLVEYFYDDLPTIVWIAVGFSALMRVELGPRTRSVVACLTPLIMGVYILHVPIRDAIRDNIPISGSPQRLVYASAVCLIAFLCTYLIRKLPFGKQLTEI